MRRILIQYCAAHKLPFRLNRPNDLLLAFKHYCVTAQYLNWFYDGNYRFFNSTVQVTRLAAYYRADAGYRRRFDAFCNTL